MQNKIQPIHSQNTMTRRHACRVGILSLVALNFSAHGQGGIGGFLGDTFREFAPRTGTKVTEQRIEGLPQYNGPRHKIAVGSFQVRGSERHTLAQGMKETLQSVLVQSGYFDVLDRTDWQADNGEVEQVNLDDIERADFIVYGDVTSIDEQSRSTGRINVPIPRILDKVPLGRGPIGIGASGKTATIRMTLKIVNARSGRALYSKDIEAKSGKSSLSIAKSGLGILGRDTQNPVNQAALQAVYEMVRLACEFLAFQPAALAANAPVDAQILAVEDGESALIVNRGRQHGVKPDMQFYLQDNFGFRKKGFSARVIEVLDDKAKLEVNEGTLPPVGATLVCQK